jgi:hypothetical protein
MAETEIERGGDSRSWAAKGAQPGLDQMFA